MVGSRLRKVRKGAGLTQAQLADLLGLGAHRQPTVCRWETGRVPISEPMARLIALTLTDLKHTRG